MAFATVEDYLTRYPDCSVPEATIQALLDEATDAIEGELAPRGIDWEGATPEYAAKLTRVCVGIVHRALPDEDSAIPFGATQASQTAGSYTFSASFSGGFGDVYVSSSDRLKLGVGQGRYAYAEPFGGADV